VNPALVIHAKKKHNCWMLRQLTPLVGFVVEIQNAAAVEMAIGSKDTQPKTNLSFPSHSGLGVRE
jgi:hypothetical protein